MHTVDSEAICEPVLPDLAACPAPPGRATVNKGQTVACQTCARCGSHVGVHCRYMFLSLMGLHQMGLQWKNSLCH